MRGFIEAWAFNNTGDKDKLVLISDFGDMHWTDLSYSFFGAKNLRTFNSGVLDYAVDLSSMFHEAENLRPNIADWNTSNVENMRAMFYRATVAEPIVTNWDTSGVTSICLLYTSPSPRDRG